MAALARDYAVPTHVVHVSSAEGIEAVQEAVDSGAPMSAETCPHYLTFSADEIPDGATPFKCAPPIREARHRDALWSALARRTCRLVASDHSPAPPSLKHVEDGDFVAAWGGIASLELSLAAVWTGAADRGFTLRDIACWMSEEPARLCGLADRKGAIRAGADADLILWDPDARFDVDRLRLQQRHKLTPYHGRRLRGVVHATYVRGVRVWSNGALSQAGHGRLL
jgi:allantoinase